MANNSRDETIKYKFDAEGGDKLDAIGKSIDDVVNKSLGTETAFGFIKQHLEELTIAALALGTALKGIEFGKEAMVNAENVEASLSRVRALAGDAAGAFGDMDDAVEKAARAVNDTTETAASGLVALVSSGLSAKDAMTALVPTLQLAKIANVDVGTAADSVTRALKAFNLPAADAQKVVDELTAASHGAAGGLSAMSAAAGLLAPDAKALGLNFIDTIGILGLLESKGLSTEKAVRGLRTVFQELDNPTSKLRIELLALGDGSNDFGKAITALSANTPRAREALLALHGAGLSMVEVLGQAGPDALAKFSAGLDHSNGIAAQTTAAIDDNLLGAWNSFGHALDDIGEKLAKPVLEPFKDELVKLAGELNKFADSPDFKDIEKQIGDMARNAATALDKFLHGIDWKAFTSDGKNAVKEISDEFASLAKSAQTVATAVNKTFSALGLVTHTLAAGMHLTAAGVSEVGAAFVDVGSQGVKGFAAVTGAGKDVAKTMHDISDALDSGAVDNLDAAGDSALATADDFDYLAGNTNDVTTSIKATGDAAQTAAPKIQTQAEATAKATVAAQGLYGTLPQVEAELKKMDAAAADAAISIDKTSNATNTFGGGPITTIKAALDKATKALADLILQGNATPEAMQQASAAVHGLSVALDAAQKSAQSAADNMKGAFAGLHIASHDSLQKVAEDAKGFFETIDQGSAQTAAGLADRQNAFMAYAKAALAASANLDEGAKASTQAQLEAKAASLGVLDALEKIETAGKDSGKSVTDGANAGAAALHNEAGAAESAAQHTKDVASAAADAGNQLGDFQTRGSGALGALDSALQGTRQGFLNVSAAAAQAFDKRLVGDFFNAFDATGIGFAKVIEGMSEAAADTNKEIAAQRAQVDNLTASYNQMGTTGVSMNGAITAATSGTIADMKALSQSIKDGTYQMGLLNQADLSKLQSALDAAIAREEQLQQQAEAAKKSFEDMAAAAQDALDQEEGNQGDLEDRRHKKQLQNLYDAAKKAGELNSANYNNAVADENKLHALKMEHIKEQQDAANPHKQQSNGATSGGGNGIGNPASNSGNAGGGNSIGGGIPSANAHGQPLQPIHIHVPGQSDLPAGSLYGTFDSAQFIAELIRAKASSM